MGELLNVGRGFERKDDKASEAWFKPLVQEGQGSHITDCGRTSILTREDMGKILDNFCGGGGYDQAEQSPSPAKAERARTGEHVCSKSGY